MLQNLLLQKITAIMWWLFLVICRAGQGNSIVREGQVISWWQFGRDKPYLQLLTPEACDTKQDPTKLLSLPLPLLWLLSVKAATGTNKAAINFYSVITSFPEMGREHFFDTAMGEKIQRSEV